MNINMNINKYIYIYIKFNIDFRAFNFTKSLIKYYLFTLVQDRLRACDTIHDAYVMHKSNLVYTVFFP